MTENLTHAVIHSFHETFNSNDHQHQEPLPVSDDEDTGTSSLRIIFFAFGSWIMALVGSCIYLAIGHCLQSIVQERRIARIRDNNDADEEVSIDLTVVRGLKRSISQVQESLLSSLEFYTTEIAVSSETEVKKLPETKHTRETQKNKRTDFREVKKSGNSIKSSRLAERDERKIFCVVSGKSISEDTIDVIVHNGIDTEERQSEGVEIHKGEEDQRPSLSDGFKLVLPRGGVSLAQVRASRLGVRLYSVVPLSLTGNKAPCVDSVSNHPDSCEQQCRETSQAEEKCVDVCHFMEDKEECKRTNNPDYATKRRHSSVALSSALLRAVPTLDCSICLERYRVGDRISWSSNALCQHVFHESCIIRWLTASVKKRCETTIETPNYKVVDDSLTCPCCRCMFVTCFHA